MARLGVFLNMIREIEDSTWGKKDINLLSGFENDRNFVLRATRQLFLDFYKQNFQGNERVLEIGSGTGFLKRNWPEEFHGEYIQLDSQAAFLKEAKNKSPHETFINGSAYELPFPDESMDVVCGYGSYDVLMDLEAATNEASRVLKKGGLFFHMLDLYPCDEPIIKDLEKRGVPMQVDGYNTSDGYEHIKEISIIPEEKIERFNKAAANIDSKPGLDGFEYTIKMHEKLWAKYSQRVHAHDYFAGKMLQALSVSDFRDIESGKIIGRFKGKRTDEQKQHRIEPFLFFHDAGKYIGVKNSAIYDLFQLNFPAMLNVLPTLHEAAYSLLKPISSSLANKIDPPCLEVSAIKYIKARK